MTHGQFQRTLEQQHVDKEASNLWLKSSSLKRATEATICAIQEQAVNTRYMQKHVYKTSDTDICRACRNGRETIYHITSGCSVLSATKYLKRHNDLAKYVHTLLLRKYGFIETLANWFEHQPKCVEENDNAKILWDFSIQTDHEVRNNRPDIVVVDKSTQKVALVDIAVPNDSNIADKRVEKLRKYTDLANEVKTLWQARKVDIVPIVVGCTGTFYKDIEKDLKKIDIESEFQKYMAQKIVLLGTAHIVRAFMNIA